MLPFWAGLILLVVWGVRAVSGDGRGGGRPDRSNALRILEERFARGEIDRDEFEARRSVLEDR
jgi:putative membrane protein